jgi:hypothetical protein
MFLDFGMVYFFNVRVTALSVSSVLVANEEGIRKVLEESCCVLVWITFPEFAWGDYKNSHEFSD